MLQQRRCRVVDMQRETLTQSRATPHMLGIDEMSRNAKSNVATIKTNAQSRANKRVVKTIEQPSIVLKTIHDDIMRDDATRTITTKQMRVKLRATMNDVHVRNSSWIFTQSQYDIVRSMFDAKYASKIAQRAKRDASKSKRATSSRVVVENVTTSHDDATS